VRRGGKLGAVDEPVILFWGPGLAGATEIARRLGWADACRWDVPQQVSGRPAATWGRIGPSRFTWKGHELLVDRGYRGPIWIPTLESDEWAKYPGDDWDRFKAAQARSLRCAAGVLFVADSQAARTDANRESLERLRAGFRFAGRDPATVPVVFALNKRDLEGRGPSSLARGDLILSTDELREVLLWPVCDFVETSARTGTGVDAAVARLVELAGMATPLRTTEPS